MAATGATNRHPLLGLREICPDLVTDEDLANSPDNVEEFFTWLCNQMSQCIRCPLQTTRIRVTLPDGAPGAKIMVVAEAPGYLEDRCGIPLAGMKEISCSQCSACANLNTCYGFRLIHTRGTTAKPPPSGRLETACIPRISTSNQRMITPGMAVRSAGAIIDGLIHLKWNNKYPRHSWLVKQGLYPNVKSIWFFTNAVLCRPGSGPRGEKAPPRIAQERCRKWLMYQWACIRPAVVVALGKTALDNLLGQKTTLSPGKGQETKLGYILFEYHPAYYMRKNTAGRMAGYGRILRILEQAILTADNQERETRHKGTGG